MKRAGLILGALFIGFVFASGASALFGQIGFVLFLTLYVIALLPWLKKRSFSHSMNIDAKLFQQTAWWQIAIFNLVTLVLSLPLTAAAITIGGHIIGSEPTYSFSLVQLTGFLIHFSGYAMIPAVLVAATLSQIRRLKVWMLIVLLLPFIPLGLLFGYVIIGSLYLYIL